MDDIWMRIVENMNDRISGPMKFRLLLQPAMATLFAILDGMKDAKTGKPPYFWGLLKDPNNRRAMELDGWKRIGKVFILALALDVVYQLIEMRFVYVGEAIFVAIVLAIVPYLLLRGLINRLARK